MTTTIDFANGLKILHSLDAHELGNPPWYPQFRDRPVDYFLRCADSEADQIWTAMVKRGAAGKTAAVGKDFAEASTRAAIRALRGLEQTAVMLEKWGPEAFPANEQGQIHFGRAITDSAAQAIRDAWTAAIVEVEAFPENEGGWIEERGRLRQAVLEIVTEIGQSQRERSDPTRRIIEIAKDALKSSLLNKGLVAAAPQPEAQP